MQKTALLALTALLFTANATVYHTSDFSSAQEAIDKVVAGDALVFDGSGDGGVTVNEPITDVQFYGGGAHWTVNADITDCAFFWHSMKLDQQSGKFRRCVLYKSMSSGGMMFTHADSVSLYYDGNYLWPKWNPESGKVPQLQFNGFMRGVLVHKPVVGLLMYSRVDGKHVFDMDHAPALRINATDEVGNGWGSYIMSPIVWEQTNWMPFHIVRATGLTIAHTNAEYNVWADPIAEIDYGVDCMLLSNGPGGRSNASNDGYKNISLIQYPDHVEYGSNTSSSPYRGATFRIGGQRNRVVGTGGYKLWTIGPKDWLPCQHIEDGITVRDPFYREFQGAQGSVGLNYAAYKNTFSVKRDGGIDQQGAAKYPVGGADVVRPVIMPIPDLRAYPAKINKKEVVDMTGKPAADIAAAANAGGSVYLGAGTYTFSSALTGGTIVGEGIGKTILAFPAGNENTNKGFINCTVKGGKYGIKSGGGILGKTLLRVRFENMDAAICNNGCWQNDVINGIEVVNCKAGFVNGPSGCSEPFKTDKVTVINSSFKDIEGHAVHMTTGTPHNGFNAVLNCTFENIGGNAVLVDGGGTHLAQNITVKNCGMSGGRDAAVAVVSRSWDQSVCMSHIDVDNSGDPKTGTGIVLGGYGVLSHATVKGFAGHKAVAAKASVGIDHVTADGSLDGGAFVAKSAFSGFSVGVDDSKVAVRSSNSNTLMDGYEQPLDDTPPPAATNVTSEKRSNDPEFPYYPEYNLVTWDPVDDPESGIIAYIVYAGGEEVGRTPGVRCNIRSPNYDNDHPTDALFRDPDVSHSNYTVMPVNGANLLPDGSQAPLRRWSAVRARWRTDNGRAFRPHLINTDNKTLTDTVRGIELVWSTTEGSPRLLNECGQPGWHNEKAIMPWGALSTKYGEELPVVLERGSALAGPAAFRLTASRFFVATASPVRLSLHDMQGRCVRVLFDGVATAGSHSVPLAGKGIAGGTYVVRLEAPGTALARRTMLVR